MNYNYGINCRLLIEIVDTSFEKIKELKKIETYGFFTVWLHLISSGFLLAYIVFRFLLTSTSESWFYGRGHN